MLRKVAVAKACLGRPLNTLASGNSVRLSPAPNAGFGAGVAALSSPPLRPDPPYPAARRGWGRLLHSPAAYTLMTAAEPNAICGTRSEARKSHHYAKAVHKGSKGEGDLPDRSRPGRQKRARSARSHPQAQAALPAPAQQKACARGGAQGRLRRQRRLRQPAIHKHSHSNHKHSKLSPRPPVSSTRCAGGGCRARSGRCKGRGGRALQR